MFWVGYVGSLKTLHLTKKKLSELTLCGNVSTSWKEVVFDSVFLNKTGVEL